MHSELELKYGISKGLSDLVVYCQAKHFNQERILKDGRQPWQMSSFAELKAEKLMLLGSKFFLWYHQVYPPIVQAIIAVNLNDVI